MDREILQQLYPIAREVAELELQSLEAPLGAVSSTLIDADTDEMAAATQTLSGLVPNTAPPFDAGGVTDFAQADAPLMSNEKK